MLCWFQHLWVRTVTAGFAWLYDSSRVQENDAIGIHCLATASDDLPLGAVKGSKRGKALIFQFSNWILTSWNPHRIASGRPSKVGIKWVKGLKGSIVRWVSALNEASANFWNVWERRGGARMGFSKCTDTILNWTEHLELNWTSWTELNILNSTEYLELNWTSWTEASKQTHKARTHCLKSVWNY